MNNDNKNLLILITINFIIYILIVVLIYVINKFKSKLIIFTVLLNKLQQIKTLNNLFIFFFKFQNLH